MWLKNDIYVSECSEDISLVKNGSILYLGDDGANELVIICDWFISPIRMNGLKTVFSLLDGTGLW